MSTTTGLTWLGILFCLTQSAMFSGLNLAVFNTGRLRLEVEAATGDMDAPRVLKLRQDPHLTLTTILWGNVGINVLLTLLSSSLLVGVAAFVFSTFAITLFGEIIPQAYFSRHGPRMAALLYPVLRAYSILLYPIAKPSGLLLDFWLGPEGPQFFREKEMRELIQTHIDASEAEVDRLEGLGAMNFLAIDDLMVSQEGEPVDPESVISLPVADGMLQFPDIERTPDDPFLRRVQASGKRWIIVTGPDGDPKLMIDSDAFLRTALFGEGPFDPRPACHRPVIVRDLARRLGDVMTQLKARPEYPGDNVIDQDVLLVWAEHKRVITGADILGRLLSGIASLDTKRQPANT